MRVRTLTVVVCVGLAGCTSAGRAEVADGVVRIAIAEPRHLLPSNTTDPAGMQVLAALYTPLIGYDGKNQPYHVAAQSVTSTDNTTWTIKLKPGYTFHNGEKVTADSYLAAWNYAAYGPNGQDNSYFFDKIDGYAAASAGKAKLSGLKKVNDLTFTVKLSTPFSEFRSMLGATPFLPMATACTDDIQRCEQQPIGNGPFRMTGTWQQGKPIEVERYDAYPGKKPSIRGAIFAETSYAELQSGDTDVYQRRPASDLNFLAFPTYQDEFANPDVRRAISMAIDRDALSESTFDGGQEPARAFVAPVVPGYRPDSCADACRFDPSAAKALYREAGGPSQLQITYNADGGHQKWVDATCAQLTANLGVPCTGVAEPTFAAVTDRLDNKQPVGLFRMRSVLSYPSMSDYLTSLYTTAGSANYSGYSNTRFDQLVREGDAARTPQLAIRKYQQAEALLAEDMPVIPLRFGQADFAYSDRVSNVDLDLFGRIDLTRISIRT